MPLYKLHAKQPDHPLFHKYDTTSEIVVRAQEGPTQTHQK